MKSAALISVTFALATVALALDFKDVEETYQCETFPIASNFDEKWLHGVPYFYAPLWSKGFAYKVTEQIAPAKLRLAKPTDSLTDFEGSCFYYSYHDNNDVPLYVYDKFVLYKSYPDPIRKGISYFSTPNITLEQPAEYSCTSYTTMTDNKTFYVSINPWAGGYKTFIVSTTVPVLPEETLSEIKKHLISFGFKPENFDVQDYTNCAPAPSSISLKDQKLSCKTI